ncbi:MAG: hypothetical protein H0X46_00720 [Bacteroidetes bacterium]|nr:hypothetical protein [Bacteroidota bacterium]
MNFSIRISFIFLFVLLAGLSFSQKDTVSKRGTIKVAKAKDGEVYIKAIPNFNKYNLSELRGDVTNDSKFQPFPVVEGYPYPFNYTRYFNDCFTTKEIDLKGKSADTVVMEVIILEGGKVYIKDQSKTIIVKGVPAVFNEKANAYELNNLHLNCLNFLKKIDKWIPGYVILPKKGKFKGEVVIRPNKKNVDVTGTVTIIFSSIPFE